MVYGTGQSNCQCYSCNYGLLAAAAAAASAVAADDVLLRRQQPSEICGFRPFKACKSSKLLSYSDSSNQIL